MGVGGASLGAQQERTCVQCRKVKVKGSEVAQSCLTL